MGRLEYLIAECNRARTDVLAAVQVPIKCGDMIAKLEHSITDRWITLAIGDGRGEWDGCPHQLALADLIESGEVIWWRDDELNVWYGAKGSKPDNQTGDNSPPVIAINVFLKAVANALGTPRYDEEGNDNPEAEGAWIVWQNPCLGVVEIDDEHNGGMGCSVHIDGDTIEVINYDFVCGSGDEKPFWKAPWPGAGVDETVRNVTIALGKLLEIEGGYV